MFEGITHGCLLYVTLKASDIILLVRPKMNSVIRNTVNEIKYERLSNPWEVRITSTWII